MHGYVEDMVVVHMVDNMNANRVEWRRKNRLLHRLYYCDNFIERILQEVILVAWSGDGRLVSVAQQRWKIGGVYLNQRSWDSLATLVLLIFLLA